MTPEQLQAWAQAQINNPSPPSPSPEVGQAILHLLAEVESTRRSHSISSGESQTIPQPKVSLRSRRVSPKESTPSSTHSPQPGLHKIASLYTDGACAGNPGPGGWGVVIYFNDGSVHEMGGFDPQTTNNRMELQAAIAALEYLTQSDQRDPVVLYTDSEYVKNGITKWIKGWKRRDWKTSQDKPVLNQDLWERLDALNSPQITWEYVRGHAGDAGNERCDAIARGFATRKPPILQQQAPLDALQSQQSHP
ncbi:ribonuclease HI [Trichothermofontia sp.]